ncbi:conserved hypothetical protein [Histoplasma capsulatum var. duboisii H88]|uniref:RRM domain-containing protein n=1 Tax=Ajellomyces capsulatus (strain H88) TaxID=544711 RepID=F0UKP1_AJEC8|nr:conserved hypothetical protein [Histoplasma capsulatum var. duboisii H88]
MENEGRERIDDEMMVVVEKLRNITEHKQANRLNGNVGANESHDERGKIQVQVCKPKEKSLLDLASSPPAPLQANLWAKIAVAAPPQAVRQTNGFHSMTPPKAETKAIPLVPIRPVVQALLSHPAMPPQPAPPTRGRRTGRAGIIIVEGKFTLGSLNKLTARICEGALYSVEIHHHTGFAEIIFQNAMHAKEFLAKDKYTMENTGFGRFGKGFTVRHDRYKERGWDADLEKMANGNRERRRLTFVRPKLLERPDSLRALEEELERMAGPEGIDFVWKFNAGNVTAVFKSVRTARLVRHRFLEMASKHRCQFAGVSVDYSADPCEKQLTLTQNGHFNVLKIAWNLAMNMRFAKTDYTAFSNDEY